MILKGSHRSGARQLGAHLLKTEENEHVEVHEVSGFVAETVLGAMKEADALSRGTRCRQHLFSVSLNPPSGEVVAVEAFEEALRRIEEKTGLSGQPRIVVFHEKEGRRHCHAVWSRIDAETMTARPLSFFKTKLNEVAKQLYLDHGWALPHGFIDKSRRDPRSFTLDEWQQAKRAGVDPKQIKASTQEAWAISDSPTAFTKALEERGLFLARGDRRGHVVMSIDGEVFALPRLLDRKTKEIVARLGDPAQLKSVSETAARLGDELGRRVRSHIGEAKRIAANAMKPLAKLRDDMKVHHQAERKQLRAGIEARAQTERVERSMRIRRGISGAWDFLTGKLAAIRRQNETEFVASLARDRAQADALIKAQMRERSELQHRIVALRERHASQVLALYKDAARLREMSAGRIQVRQPGFDLER